MTDPDISRRCPACGVSIRERAMFCPQCGEALPDKWNAAEEAPKIESVEGDSERPQNIVSEPPVAPVATELAAPNRPAAAAATRPLAPPVKGVKKLRQISTVVLDEAAYDPSLRFLLVALALFLLFLFILLLSKLIG